MLPPVSQFGTTVRAGHDRLGPKTTIEFVVGSRPMPLVQRTDVA
jgi:hypothetical protein